MPTITDQLGKGKERKGKKHRAGLELNIEQSGQ